MHLWPSQLLDGIPFATSSVLLEPVPDTAELPAIALLSQFSPKLADVAAALKQALIKIAGIGVDRVLGRDERSFQGTRQPVSIAARCED